MRIIFKTVKFSNFMSYKEEASINFKNGLTLINAKNGQGKSTISDAVFYGLFGKAFRKIKNSSLINDITNKGLLVELEFDIIENENSGSYKIIRGQKPSKFLVYKNGNLIPELATTREYQEYLETKILNFNENVFRQLISLSANNSSSKEFMDLTTREKEEVFQAITDTSLFSSLEKKIKEKLKELKEEVSQLEYKEEVLNTSILSEQSVLETAQEEYNSYLKNHSSNINSLEETIVEHKNKVTFYKESLIKLKELKDKYLVLQKELNSNKELEIQSRKDKDQKIFELHSNLQKEKDSLFDEYSSNQATINTSTEGKIKLLQEQYSEESKHKSTLLELEENLIEMNKDYSTALNKLAKIESLKQGSIECSNCSTVNYISSDEESLKLIDSQETILENKKSLSTKIDSIKSQIEELKNKLQKEKEQKEENFLQEKRSIYESNKEKIKNIKINYETALTVIQEKIDSEIQSISANYNNETKVLLETINKQETEVDSLKEKLMKGKLIKDNIETLEETIVQNTNKLEALKNTVFKEPDFSSLNLKKEQKKEIQEALSKYSSLNSDYNYILSIIQDKTENNLKSKILSRTVPLLNKEINNFLEKFSMNDFSFVVHNNFKEEIIAKSKAKDKEFNNLSNGQKARISFSIMFSFLVLIEQQSGVSTNLLLLDEVLDTSVDSEGREELLTILNETFSQSKNVLIISHNTEIQEKLEVFNRIIEVNRINSFSTLDIQEI